MDEWLHRKFGFVEPWTDYYVANRYYHPEQFIPEHNDADSHWGAIRGETVIATYTLDSPGIFIVSPAINVKYKQSKCLYNAWPSFGEERD